MNVALAIGAPQPAARRRAIIVLGMHRSGTSAMTRLLGLSGGALPEPPIEPAPDNPDGYWEPAEMVALDDALLGAAGARWDEVFALEPHEGAAADGAGLRERARAFLAASPPGAGPIVLKDPRASVLVRFWRAAVEEAGLSPFFVLMVRHPLEVADSLAARNDMARERSVLLWASHMLAAERDTRDADRVFVSYDALLTDWRRVLTRLEERLGAPLPHRTPAAARAIDLFLSDAHRHHRVPMPDDAAWPAIGAGWRAAYQWLEAAAHGANGDPAPLAAAAEQLRAMQAMLGPVVADLRRERTALRHEGETLRADAAFWRLQADANGAKVGILRQELHHLWSREREVEQLRVAAREAEARLEAGLHEARQRAERLASRIRALKASPSWRLTRPLRALARRLGRD